MSSPSPAPGHLLFGILALNTNFVNRTQFLDALTDWKRQAQTPLPELIARRASLDEAERLALGKLLNACAKRHGGAQKAVEALLDPYLRLDLDAVLGGEKPNMLATLPPSGATVFDPLATLPPSSMAALAPAAPVPPTPPPSQPVPSPAQPVPSLAPTAPPPPRYRRLAPLARDGFGEVSVAYDEELNREVVLKEIQAGFARDAALRARFLREAEIAGHLEHPGVAPVYGLGFYPDGRPYYAVRYVKGRSLREAIERLHKGDGPSRDARTLRQLLTRFVAVCHTVAYAHNQGIIHCDLRPAHVILGDYGETLLTGWGLARAYDRPDRYAAGDDGAAEVGHAVGSPAYQSPEQAQGVEVGPASDVWALGGILYEIITGQAPHAGAETPAETLELACRGEVIPARRRAADAPAALEAVCDRAMAFQSQDRYRDARELAADVERFLADEPVEGSSEPMADRLARWMRRNRALATACLGLVGAGALLLLGCVAALCVCLFVQH